MKKRLYSLALALVLALSLAAPTFAAEATAAVQIEGKAVEGSAQVVSQRTFLPSDVLTAALGAEGKLDGETFSVTKDGKTVALVPGAQSFAVTVGQETLTVPLDAPAFRDGATVYLPLRALCEVLGYWVDWESETGTATVKTPAEVALNITVTGQDGKAVTKAYAAKADNLGDFLETAGIAVSEIGPYGRFITTVNGYRVNDDKHEWWCITKGGADVMTGVDLTPIANGDSFELTLKTY
ncbi:MAG: stalk domain-containing protein [Oscillospiraceae bacterium]